MKAYTIDKKEIKNWAHLFNDDAKNKILRKNVSACGVEFQGAPQGVIVYETGADCRIIYIYVVREFRLMGLGRSLVFAMGRDLYEKGIKEIFYSFTENDNRQGLSDFFEAVGGVSFPGEYEYGSVSVGDLRAALKEQKLAGASKAIPFKDVLPSKRKEVSDFVEKITGKPFMGSDAEELSGFVLGKDGVRGLLLLSREDAVVHIDYLGADKDPRVFAELMKWLYGILSDMDPADMYVDMLLTSAQALKLYGRLGMKTETVNIVQGSMDVEVLYEDAEVEDLLGD